MTVAHLQSAYGGESMAHMRYRIWGEKARKEGFPNVGRLFRAISAAEEVHATNHFTELRNEAGDADVATKGPFGLGSTGENLVGAIGGEEFEIDQMYPVYLNAAQFQDEKGAERSFRFALEAEKQHAEFFRRAKESVDGGRDLELGPIQICEVCGHTVEGDAPEQCPICLAKKEKFKAFA
jgi:rubrerythrin